MVTGRTITILLSSDVSFLIRRDMAHEGCSGKENQFYHFDMTIIKKKALGLT